MPELTTTTDLPDSGDDLTIEYDPANGDATQTLTATVDENTVDGVQFQMGHITLLRDGDDHPSRRLDLTFHDDGELVTAEVEGKNGARWNRISSGYENPTITVHA